MVDSNHEQFPPHSNAPGNHGPAHGAGAPIAPPPLAHAHEAEHAHVPTRYSPRTNWTVTLVAVLVAVGLAVAFFLGTHKRDTEAAALKLVADQEADRPTPINVMHVQHAPAENVIVLPGEAKSFAETVIFARTSGYLSEWKVDIGDKVIAGQILATIDNPELDDQLAAARAKVAALKAEVAVARTNANFAQVSADRWIGAAPEGVVSAQERDQKNAELANTLAKVEAANSQVTLAEADIQRLTTLKKFEIVRAPYEGTIIQRHVDIGALVTAGSTNNTSSLFTISQSDQIRVFVDIPQPLVAAVKVGMDVAVRVSEYPGKDFPGHVDRTAESLDPVSKMLRVQVLVQNKEGLLLPGMYCEVSFKSNRAQPPLRIPAAALCLRPTGPKVAVIDDRGCVAYRDIKIGRDLGDYIEISSGLSGDETVALNIGSDVTDGSRIEARVITGLDPAAPKPAAVSAVLHPAPTHAPAPAHQ